MRADLDAVVADLGFALFEHFASDVAQPRQQSSKILSRMELRLMLDAHGWRADERRLADEADVEAKALGKRHFIADSLMVVCERLFVSVDIGVKKSWNPRKVTVDVETLDELIDLIDGRPPASHGLRVVLPSVDARSVRLASTTGVRCAVVQPVSMPPTRPRSTKATRHPASFNRRAAVMPVRPPPTTTASTSSEWRSAGNLGRSIWSHQGMGRKSFMGISLLGRRSNCPAGEGAAPAAGRDNPQ